MWFSWRKCSLNCTYFVGYDFSDLNRVNCSLPSHTSLHSYRFSPWDVSQLLHCRPSVSTCCPVPCSIRLFFRATFLTCSPKKLSVIIVNSNWVVTVVFYTSILNSTVKMKKKIVHDSQRNQGCRISNIPPYVRNMNKNTSVLHHKFSSYSYMYKVICYCWKWCQFKVFFKWSIEIAYVRMK